MIGYEDAEKALEYLKNTDKEAARRKAYASALDDMKKSVLALVYNDIEGGSAADKLKKAEGHKDYIDHLNKLRTANEEHLIMQNKRITAATQIEMWRSVNSAMKMGNI